LHHYKNSVRFEHKEVRMGRKAVAQRMPENVFPKEPPSAVSDELDEDQVGGGVEADADAGDPDDSLIGDNVGEPSVEINVEGLIAELEAESRFVSKPDMISARRKLEDYLERRRVAQEIEDFDDFKVVD
jgi:hypothetical protein